MCARTCQLIMKMRLLNREKGPGPIMLVPLSSCTDAEGLVLLTTICLGVDTK